MGRKKSRPIKSGGIVYENSASAVSLGDTHLENANSSKQVGTNNNEENSVCTRTIYIDIDGSAWDSTEHFDIAEVILCDANFYNETVNYGLIKDRFNELKFALRFRLCNVKEGSFRLGQWPILSAADSIFLEYLSLDDHNTEDRKNCSLILAGHLDGSDDSVSSLVHLVSLKFLALRPIHVINDFSEVPPLRLRVEVLKNAFDACESLLETVRQPWRKSLMNVMSWLRPEVTTSESIYGLKGPIIPTEDASRTGPSKHTGFDVAGFYEAIKPSREEPVLDEKLPELLPCLRPYQLRAVYWMIQREKATDENSGQEGARQLSAPYSVPVVFLEKSSKMFYNPFNGSISMHSDLSALHVPGGILADEMGLGKTVELLACILAHRRPSMEVDFVYKSQNCFIEREPIIKRQKRERVECICGAASEHSKYKGLWVQCDLCDAWQHAQCVGYSLKKNSFVSHENNTEDGSVKVMSKSKFSRKNKGTTNVIEIDGNYICSLCSELIEAAKIDTYTGATLIVCPAPILVQWQSEIMRHTRSGSLKICNYEGARYLDSLITSRTDMMELASADIVLTTYDVLKEDLSHDSDRHDGDRHFLRFQKRYPVVPTPLTRIYWWRLCLDEAQMVESNQASVTEMAMRLHAQHRWCISGTPIQRRLDDLYGLLRFLRASPFDVYRWWVEIIRDPYERTDLVAMQFVHNFFKQIMWRSSKLHVADELQLPAQEECLSWLTFSAIEEHFYRKQHETCVSHAHEIIKKLKDDHRKRDALSDPEASCYGFLSHSEVAKLVGPLLKLRQACCHPQVGSSGLCALQQNPLTMEEILDVLIGKAKIEGEEALRKVVSSLNGLAAIAVIEEDAKRAVSLYREALALADENSVDFRLDPLLNLHIHHNLAELIPLTSEFSSHCLSSGSNPLENNQVKKRKETSLGKFEKFYVKRGKRSKNCKPICSRDDSSLMNHNTIDDFNWPCPGTIDNSLKSSVVDGPSSSSKFADSAKIGSQADASCRLSSGCYAVGCLRKTCENIKQKYLSVFIMKISLAQEEFKTSSMQVSSILKELESPSMIWWSHALYLINQNKESSEELRRKIEQALSGNAQSAGLSRVSSRCRSISGLLYNIQTSLDSLGSSRQALISRLMEIDQSMENPKDDDIERLRYCPSCYDGDGPLCLHCELDGLFQVYQARLSLVRKASNYAMFESVEEALDMQKRKFELNLFFRNSKSSELTDAGKSKERFIKGAIQVLKIPSELETTLRVIKSHSKTILGKEGMESAKKHLLLFEAMRKEYAQARSLARAQAMVLRAYDEIKMATSRLRLKAAEDDTVAIDVLSKEELIPSSLQLSSEKFVSFSSLQRIKGQLRYLKGMVLSNQIKNHECLDSFSMPQDTTTKIFLSSTEESVQQTNHEPCPICHEKIMMQKMVFECGHVICCKCCLRMTEHTMIHSAKNLRKWITCPTCRQRTDFENIAFVDERQNKGGDSIPSSILKTAVESENAITVKGSYGTKIESVIRRILWITMKDQGAKILAFSSWNDVLDVLGHALAANNITFVRMKGGRKSQVAIAQFKGEGNMQAGEKTEGPLITSKSVQVLMMLVQHGANGLNLLESQHVILMEPLLNPAAEAQAISRIHRVGQDKKTFIHRFIVRNTIEEGIYKLNMTRSMSSVISAKASKNQDQPVWTLKDVESLFPMATPSEVQEDGNEPAVRLRDLPPAVAAGLAAQIRLAEGQIHS